jgi:hypothetical protein
LVLNVEIFNKFVGISMTHKITQNDNTLLHVIQ